MEDEDWYPAWQHCCTLKTSGPINRERPSFYERVPNGFSKLIKICKKRLAEWQENPIEDVRLKRWIKAMWMTTSQISEIEKLYNSESNKE